MVAHSMWYDNERLCISHIYIKSPNNFNDLIVHTEDFMVICAYILYVPIVQYYNQDIHILHLSLSINETKFI